MKKLKIFQKSFLLLLIVFSIFLFSARHALAARPLVGVIRYDQFDDPNDPDLATLSPEKWHDRVPWFLDMSTNSVSGTWSQTEFNQDMQYAIRGGIDYFAHLETVSNSAAVTYHMASPYKNQVKFAIIIHLADQKSDTYIASWSTAIVNYFKDPSYQKVMAGRPLLFILTWDQRIIDQIKSKCQVAGIPEPYIKSGFENYMYTQTAAKEYIGYPLLKNYTGYPFSETMTRNILHWDTLSYKSTRIPNITIGNDQRPRWEIPPPWGAFSNPWFEQPTTSEITYFVGKALDWVVANNTEANSILIYAWDEVAEGGWLVPTHSEGDVRIRALGDFLANYNVPSMPVELLGHWKFDETSGITASDSSGNNNAGILMNGAVWTNGKLNGGLSLDGINDYVQVPSSSKLRPVSGISFGGWLKTSGVNNNFVMEHPKDPWVSYAMRVSGSGSSAKINCKIGYDSGTSTHQVTSLAAVGDNTWHHAMCVYDKQNLKVYVDGIESGLIAGANNIYYYGSVGVRLGFHYESGTYFNGFLDDMRIYNLALGASEVAALYGGSVSDTTAPAAPSGLSVL
ncbi:MAG: LamG-like jellyroll fold domain-containing protein [Parcubacteria group bacterium]